MVISISGLTGKRFLVSLFFLFLAGMVFGYDMDIVPPKFKSDIPGIDLNNEVKNYFKNFRKDLKNELDNFLPESVDKLAGGFANASIFTSDAASQRGYEGYNAFSITVGPMIAFQFPQDSIKDILSIFYNEGVTELVKYILDIPFGFDVQISAQFGINTSKFLLEGLYLGFKFIKFDTNWIKDMPSEFSFSTMSIGVNASYQLIRQKRLLAGLLVWRGLNLGTGFIWQNTSLGLTTALPIPEELATVKIPTIPAIGDINMPLNPNFHLDFETKTYIVPMEAMTSIRLAGFFNLALGAGVDVAFGGSSINISGSFNVDEDKIDQQLRPLGITMEEAPKLELRLGGMSRPSIFNVKIMGAVGFNFGPVLIDIPVTYYLFSNGYSIGLTFGVTL